MIEIIGCATLGVLIQNFYPYQWLIKKIKINVKPFNCTLCGTFWMSLGYFLGQGNGFISSLLLSSTSALLAEFIDRKLNTF